MRIRTNRTRTVADLWQRHSRRPLRVLPVILLATSGLVALAGTSAASASTSTTIGQDITWASACNGFPTTMYSMVQESTAASGAGDPSYVVPPGVNLITSWSTAPGYNRGLMALEIWQPTATPGTYILAAVSSVQYIPPSSYYGQVDTFPLSPPMTVAAGDILGADIDGGNCTSYTGLAQDVVGFSLDGGGVGSTPLPGYQATFPAFGSLGDGTQLNISATGTSADSPAPMVTSVLVSSDTSVGETTTVTARIDASPIGNPAIASADFNVNGGTWYPMSAQAPLYAFSSSPVLVTATVPGQSTPGTYTVCVRATDYFGNTSDGTTCSSFQVFGDTTPPVVSAVTAAPVVTLVGHGTTLTATVDDSSTGNSNIASADYSINGGSWEPMSAQGGYSFDTSPTVGVTAAIPAQTSSSAETLCVRGTDSAGNTSDGTACTSFVAYNPSAGFVTGGGWIPSPPGACQSQDPSVCQDVAGKATFGFVSKYAKAATVPSGSTQYVLHDGDLNFTGSSDQWLVVDQSGTNAQFQGSGTINGRGSYIFMIWATQGSPNTFRILITDATTQATVYDSGSQVLGGGSISIHK
jgi:hypothetical protein